MKAPSYADALIPVFTLIILVGASVSLFGLNAVQGPLQVAIIVSTMITALIILKMAIRGMMSPNQAAKEYPRFLVPSLFYSP